MRNYKNEAKWAKEKYERIEAKIDKDIGKELKRVLKQNDTSMTTWITESALVYLNVKMTDELLNEYFRFKNLEYNDKGELLNNEYKTDFKYKCQI